MNANINCQMDLEIKNKIITVLSVVIVLLLISISIVGCYKDKNNQVFPISHFNNYEIQTNRFEIIDKI